MIYGYQENNLNKPINMASKYEWQYCSLGGAIRVKIGSGEDIAHLGELDQKLWTVLSCPVEGLEFDKQTLEYLDTEKDGKIMVNEVVQAAQWLTSVIKDKNSILNGDSVLQLNNIDTSTAAGKGLYNSARQILKNLGIDKDEISLADASDSKAIFAGTKLNGDGIITALSTSDDAQKQIIADIIATVGSVGDRSGEKGVNAELIEKFYASCADWAAWKSSAPVMPYGERTAAAFTAYNALKDKMNDYFTRCRLVAFDTEVAKAVNVAVTDINDIDSCPIAAPKAARTLDMAAINPAWQKRFDTLASLTGFSGKTEMTEADWRSVETTFNDYAVWLGAKKGAEVETLGEVRINAILIAGEKEALLALVERDKALAAESSSIDEVKKLMYYYRDFYRLLKNFVLFTDFYSRAPDVRAMFELGQLYIDQRCCDLCIRISDMSKHADMAAQSGIFLIYFKATSKVLGKSMDAVAVMTDGDIFDLRPGKNGIFYDLQGNNWDAVITKVVDNPVSISQAFWAPYRKAWEFCVGIINKSAADKDAKINADLQAKVQTAAAKTPGAADAAKTDKQQAFDIAKFAGIFAALGMAMGYIGTFLTSIVTGIQNTPPLDLILILLGLMLVISGPSCFIAWTKLRKRNLGPILNANGWAINSKVLVNILFGGKLTTVAKYPKLKLADPYDQKTPAWKIWLPTVLIILAIAFLALYFTGNLEFIGLSSPLHKAGSACDAVKVAADSLSVK